VGGISVAGGPISVEDRTRVGGRAPQTIQAPQALQAPQDFQGITPVVVIHTPVVVVSMIC